MEPSVATLVGKLSEKGHAAYVADIEIESKTNGNTPATIKKLRNGAYDRL